MAVQSGDGKIVVAGQLRNTLSGDSAFGVARYNPDGTLDTTFSAGAGFVTAPFGEGFDVNDVAIQDDGKIVVVGAATVNDDPEEMAIVRYNSSGTLDTGFDGPSGTGNGVVLINPESGREDAAKAVDITPNNILVGGFADTNDSTAAGFNYEFALVSLNKTDGTLDTSFDGDGGTGNGIVLTDVVPGGFDSEINDIRVSGGNVVAAGLANTDLSDPGNSFAYDFAVARYSASTGVLDTSFDGDSGTGNGIVTTPVGPGSDSGRAVAVQGDGKIVVAGESDTSSNESDFSVARYSGTDGKLDTGFDGPAGTGNGKFTITVSSDFDAARSVAVDGSGRIVLGGPATPAADREFAVARLNGSDGSLDLAFSGGTLTADLGPGNDFARSLALQADGRILLAGSSDNSSGGIDFSVARFLAADTPFISLDDPTVTEGNSGTTNATFTISLDQVLGMSVAVDYATADGTATASSDYTAQPTTTVVFAPGQTSKTVTVPVNGDTAVEHDETFTLNLSNPVNGIITKAQGTATIKGDDQASTLETTSTPDITPPNTKLGKHPKKKTNKRKAKFTFSSTEPGSSFQCKLDRKPFKPCSSPNTVKVKPGQHTFRIAAIDAAGNRDPSPAKFNWKVLKP